MTLYYQPLPLRTLPGLGEGQEHGASGDRAGDADRVEQTAGGKVALMAKLRDPRSPSMIRNGAGLPSAMVSHTVDVAVTVPA